MRKFKLVVLSFFCFLLAGCSNAFDISKILFIASIGIEKGEDKTYSGYFYLPLSSDIGKTDSAENKGKGQYAKVSGNSIPDLFKNVDITSSLKMNFRHVSSIVLKDDLVTDSFIREFIDFIKYSLEIDFNCYLFTTKEKLKDIYEFENPNQESVLNSMLVSTADVKDIYLVAKPMHFLEFSRRYFSDRSLFLPYLDVEEIWSVDGSKVKNCYCVNALYFYQGTQKKVIENPGSPYLTTTKKFDDLIEDASVSFKNYKIKVKYNEIASLSVHFDYEIYQSQKMITEDQIKNYIKNRITNYLKEYQDMDPLDLKYYATLKKKVYSYEELPIHFDVKLN